MTAPVLRTARLVLRPLGPQDAGAIAAAFQDFEVVRWLSAPPWPYRRADAEWFVTEGQADGLHWALDDGAGLIGVVSVRPELGYWLSPDRHRQGLMTEAAAAALDHAFADGVTDVTSGHFQGNAASRGVLTKLGFVDTHTATAFAKPLGRDVWVQKMRLTRKRWEARDG